MPTISLCMIVRNEEDVLARCLESVKDVVDEIIIVDTGSVDRTKEIAAFYTNKIYDFAWIDDFAAARNYSFSRATMDYCMWMDADDVLPEKDRIKLLEWKNRKKEALLIEVDYKEVHKDKENNDEINDEINDVLKNSPSKELWPDVVMMKYVTAFDEFGKGIFSFYRERLLRRKCGFLWNGRVHEAITPSGTVEYLDVSVEHRSEKKEYTDRNLRIYEKMKADGAIFESRDLFYYARELYYHKKYGEAVDNFEKFLSFPDGFVENKVKACRIAAYSCYELSDEDRALGFLLWGLKFRVPSGELCCDIGKHFYDRKDWEQAIFWYRSALRVPRKDILGGFVSEDSYGYLPCVQLSVCYDKLGDKKRAFDYHCLAGRCKPYGKEYLMNKEYFEKESYQSGNG